MNMHVFDKPHDYLPAEKLTILFEAQTIASRLDAMASDIVAELGHEFVIVGLLKGSFVFTADLVRALHKAGATPQIDFITLSSYGDAKESSGTVTMHHGLADNIEGKPVLMLDDILESGRTLVFARESMLQSGASSVHACVLLDKPVKRIKNFEADFVGFHIDDHFVVGYGLDYAGYYRELPFIGLMQPAS